MHFCSERFCSLQQELTSCKDYDDDINNLQEQINTVVSDLESLKTTVDNLGGVTDVKIEGGKLLVTAGGQTISYDLPAATEVEQTTVELDGQDLKVNGEVIGQVGDKVTVNEDGYLCVNGVATEIKAGKYAILEDDANGVYTITLPDANGELKTITLPKASSAITGLTVDAALAYKTTSDNYIVFSEKYLTGSNYTENSNGIYWGVASSDMNDWTGTLGAIKKGQVLVGQISTATVNVTPANFDLSNVKLTLVDTKGNTAPATVTATKSNAQNQSTSGSRAAAVNGEWTLSIVPTTDDMGNAFAGFNESYAVKNVLYALAADGIVLTPYNIIVDTKTNAEVAALTSKPTFTDSKLKIGNVADASNAFASVELGDNKIVYEMANICDIQVDIAQESIDDAELLGITLDKTTNTLKVSDKAAANTDKKIKLNVVLLDANGKKSDSKTFTITSFGKTTVNDKVTLATTNYTLTPSTAANAKNIIINMEDVFSGLTAEQSTALSTVTWTADANFLISSISGVNYYADEADAKKNDTAKAIDTDDQTAGRVRTIKYAVIPVSSYVTAATAGEHNLNIVLSTAQGEIKKVVVPVNVVVPAFTDIFTKTADQWNGDTFATTLLSESTNKTVLGYATAFNKTTGTAYNDITITYAKVKDNYIVGSEGSDELSSDAKVELTKANIVDATTGTLKATTVQTTVAYSFSDYITTKYTFTTEIHSIFENPQLVYYKNGSIVETAEIGADGLIAPLSYKSDGVTPVTGLAIKFGKDVKPFKADQAVDGITLKASSVSDTNIQVYTQISVKDVQSATTSFDTKGATVSNVNQGTLVATFTDANGVKTKAEIPFLK